MFSRGRSSKKAPKPSPPAAPPPSPPSVPAVDPPVPAALSDPVVEPVPSAPLAAGGPTSEPQDLGMEGPSSAEVLSPWPSQDHHGPHSSPSFGMSMDSHFGHSRTPSMENMIVLGSYSKNSLEVSESVGADDRRYGGRKVQEKCNVCREWVGRDEKGDAFVPCECAFPICRGCYEYIREYEEGLCPQCREPYKRMKGSPTVSSDPPEAQDVGGDDGIFQPLGKADKRTTVPKKKTPVLTTARSMKVMIEGPPEGDPGDAKSMMDGVRERNMSVVPVPPKTGHGLDPVTSALLSIQILDPTKNMDDYGYGSISWADGNVVKSVARAAGGGGGQGAEGGVKYGGKNISVDDTRRPLARVIPISGNSINPYRLTILVRFVVLCLFLKWRVQNPNNGAFVLWLLSVVCEIWFGISWILDQAPKWAPITRETYLDRLSLRYERPGEPNKLLPVDIFITTADAEKEPPLVTANVVLSVLAMDYPVDKIACYVSDDGSSMLTFEALTETASFARAWVPFCKKHEIEPRAPEMYFQLKLDYTKGKTNTDFIKERRHMKRAYDEFKVRINALVAKSKEPPEDGWKMQDNSPWPGNDKRDHVGMIQVFLQPDGDTKDINGDPLPRLVYVSREKRPGVNHNKKAGAMNALIRTSALITNGPFILNLDCDHYINNAKAIREAMCFLMDPKKGSQVCYVQFPQRFDGVDKNDRYANHNTIFFDVNMKGLDGVQGPMYVGTGCVFRRQALYGFCPPLRGNTLDDEEDAVSRGCCASLCCCCFCCGPRSRKAALEHKRLVTAVIAGQQEEEGNHLVPTQWHTKRFGMCRNFVATVGDAEGSVPDVGAYQVLSDVILVISCGYEENTEWGKTVGWMYGSVTEDIVTGLIMHVNGWHSVYCMPKRSAFKGSAPINLTDRLGQVLRWATGSVEIFFSKHNPLFHNYFKSLKVMQRLAYINTVVYPFTSLALLLYCFLPAFCLFTNQFIINEITEIAVLYFLLLFISIFLTSILEIRWSGVTLEEWWRNEQFWVIGGTSAHLAAVTQGLLKVIFRVDISFTLTQKGNDNDDDPYAELYAFRWTWLMVPPTTIIMVNIISCFAGVSREMYKDRVEQNWGRLMGMVFFSFWVLSHLYPFAKGLMGKTNKTPTIVIVWSILLAIVLSLLWVHVLSPRF
ncbi:hypothetical protein CBR_g31305 [Chara braunii]|uniref:Cellulose synthase n=1 Tax=Chara braunii TaxID=69332 RepID=A0A388LEL0_CHABU|nr:hypothetical protein CBR_g31305 [Chara braunii]|eukprot:GBG80750.1 hypothetical protein CBR_g31305 [Chara braunii]